MDIFEFSNNWKLFRNSRKNRRVSRNSEKNSDRIAICRETARHRSMIQLESSPPLETHRPAVSSIIIHLERSWQIQHIKMTEHARLHDLYKKQRKNFGIILPKMPSQTDNARWVRRL